MKLGNAVTEERPMAAKTPTPGRPPSVEPDAPTEFEPAGEEGDDPITRNLKKVYAEIAAEPIPDELLSLLAQLDGDDGEGT
jgi:hypothetical protein